MSCGRLQFFAKLLFIVTFLLRADVDWTQLNGIVEDITRIEYGGRRGNAAVCHIVAGSCLVFAILCGPRPYLLSQTKMTER